MEPIGMKKIFKVLWIVGAILLFISFFLDTYYFQIYDLQGHLLAAWNYNPFFDWYLSVNNSRAVVLLLAPPLLEIPVYLPIIFIGILFAAMYGILFKDIDNETELENLTTYSYLNFCALGVSIFYIFILPVFYLFGNGHYVPVLQVVDEIYELTFLYSIAPGYFLQCISFLLLFPYTFFYYHTIATFYAKEHTPDKVIDRYIKRNSQPVDFERMIQEEELSKEGYEAESIVKKLKKQLYGGSLA
jgi:hypothetical protein